MFSVFFVANTKLYRLNFPKTTKKINFAGLKLVSNIYGNEIENKA